MIRDLHTLHIDYPNWTEEQATDYLNREVLADQTLVRSVMGTLMGDPTPADDGSYVIAGTASSRGPDAYGDIFTPAAMRQVADALQKGVVMHFNHSRDIGDVFAQTFEGAYDEQLGIVTFKARAYMDLPRAAAAKTLLGKGMKVGMSQVFSSNKARFRDKTKPGGGLCFEDVTTHNLDLVSTPADFPSRGNATVTKSLEALGGLDRAALSERIAGMPDLTPEKIPAPEPSPSVADQTKAFSDALAPFLKAALDGQTEIAKALGVLTEEVKSLKTPPTEEEVAKATLATIEKSLEGQPANIRALVLKGLAAEQSESTGPETVIAKDHPGLSDEVNPDRQTTPPSEGEVKMIRKSLFAPRTQEVSGNA